jgi:hypothetical protein
MLSIRKVIILDKEGWDKDTEVPAPGRGDACLIAKSVRIAEEDL